MMRYPEAYTDYLIYFHAERDYFECHEVMEEFWKEHPGDERSQTYVALIQIAVGSYHDRRGNRAGAVKMLQSAARNLDAAHTASLGLDYDELIRMLRERIAGMQGAGHTFADMNLPISDPELAQFCQDQSREQGLVWQAPSLLDNEELIHKHTRRDRSAVIEEREAQKRLRAQKGARP